MIQGAFKRTMVVGAVILVLLGIAGGIKYLGSRGSGDDMVLSGTIEADEIHVGSRVAGRIAEVLVREGQEVTQDQPMIRFETFDLDSRRKDALAAAAAAEANYQKALSGFRPEEVAQAREQAEAARMTYEIARNGPRKQEIDAARAEVKAAEADQTFAKATLDRVARLTETGVQSRQEYDNARTAFDRATARRDAALERLNLLLAGTRPEEIARAEKQYRQALANLEMLQKGSRQEDIDAAKAQLDRARANLGQIETQLSELEVRSPAHASIEQMQVRPGELIQPGSPVATLIEVNRLWVRVYVPETEKGHVQLGKPVSVTVDTFGERRFNGTIEHIASRGEFTPRNVQTRDERQHQVFAVRVRLDNSERLLSAGMAADVKIQRF
jgi:multidrug resistance efflux pump